jgi:hypothetical protein
MKLLLFCVMITISYSYFQMNGKSLLVRGSLLACGLKHREALRDLKSALRLHPQHQCCIDLIASVLKAYANENIDEAFESCESVLDIIPGNRSILQLKQELAIQKITPE